MEPFTARQFRHTAATRGLRVGVDTVAVAELLGHADLETTRLYTRPPASITTHFFVSSCSPSPNIRPGPVARCPT
jgi:integrase